MKSARRPLGRWRRNDRKYGGFLRETRYGWEAVDHNNTVVAGPNRNIDLVIRMAHDVGVEVGVPEQSPYD